MKIISQIKKHPIWTIWIITFTLFMLHAIVAGRPAPSRFIITGLTLSVISTYLILNTQPKTHKKQIPITENISNNEYGNKYQRRYLLTKNEYAEWKKLKRIADQNNLIVCVKVRLLDLIEPRRGDEYMSLLGRIQSKHVDFVICDQDLRVKAILELDDNSHNQDDRKQRDLFVDQVLTGTGYKVIRTRSITENTLVCITAKEENNPWDNSQG